MRSASCWYLKPSLASLSAFGPGIRKEGTFSQIRQHTNAQLEGKVREIPLLKLKGAGCSDGLGQTSKVAGIPVPYANLRFP